MNNPNETVPKLLLTASEAAKALRISERTLWGLSQPRGHLPTIRLGRRVLYYRRNLEAFIEAQPGVAQFLDTPEAKNKARYELKGWPK